MSYILDALRKAERDRNLGRTPSLGDVTAAAARPPSRRPSSRTLALIALVVVLLIATVLLWPRRPAPEPSPTQAPVAAAQPAPAAPTAAAPVASPPAPPPEIAAAPPAERTLAPDVPAESIDDLLDESELPADSVEEVEVQPSATVPAPKAEAPEAPPAPAVVEEESEPAPVEEDAVASDVPLLRDMPSDYRGAFPSLRVDVHVYDEDPERRWVMVNGRKAAEGTTLGEGPTVSRITPEGIVFDYRGASVLFPLNR